MSLRAGTKLGPYEIVAPAGAGGMGEVYRARDTRLDRTVAVKVLPARVASDAGLRQRLEREARAISSLQHPHICTLHDIGHQDGIDYLVLEYLEGETLADRLTKGPLPLQQALKIGIEIADALDKAHRRGIVHRDLKPGNIMLTKSGAKLMDFGLAKPAVATVLATGTEGLTRTITKPLTSEHTLVGTIQYMSPEQLEGKEADARSDVFALGAVLYEMATGKRAFEGKSAMSVASAILEKEPEPISKTQPLTPPALDYVVAKCLAKDPDERIQTAHDVKLQLIGIGEFGPQTSTGVNSELKRRERLGWAVAGVLLLAVIGMAAAWWLPSRQPPRTAYFSSPFPFPANDVALSPNGRTVALVAYDEQANKYVIWKHDIGDRTATVLPGTEGASHPFWSPDGNSLGFFADGRLKKIDIAGGAPQVLCDAPHGRGGAWNRDGVILFAPETATGLYRVSSSGGTPTEVTHVDRKFEQTHRWPAFLPDGEHFLYLAGNFSGDFQKNTIYAGSLHGSDRKAIVAASSNVAYVDSGYLLYVRDNALVAQHFDAKRLVLQGDPHTITDEVQYFAQIDLGVFAVGGRDTLVVQTGTGADKSQLTWFDRSGKQVGTVGTPGLLSNPALSPDDRRLALSVTESDGRHEDVWIRDLATEAMTRLTFSPGLNELPVWTPDGKQVVYASNQQLHWDIKLKNADGSGSEQDVTQSSLPTSAPWSWSKDGKNLVFLREGQLWLRSWPEKTERRLLDAKMVRHAQFSPDGKWLAYASNETGQWEVYVSPFPTLSSKWQVSQGGGEEPRWRGDGKELFFVSAEGKMMALPVNTRSSFQAGSPVALFQTHLRQPISATDMISYDVSRDGKRFLINTKVDEPNTMHLSVILHWAAQMDK